MEQFILDGNGFVIGVYDGPLQQPNSTTTPPIATADGSAPKFVNGVWVDTSKLPLLTPMQFYLAFKAGERMLLKALATTGVPVGSALVSPAPSTAIAADPVITEFWATYQLAVQSNASVNPNLDSIQEGLEYLASPAAPTPAVIASSRIPQILQGIAQ